MLHFCVNPANAPLIETKVYNISKHGMKFSRGLQEDVGGFFSVTDGNPNNPFLAIAGKLDIRTQFSFEYEY